MRGLPITFSSTAPALCLSTLSTSCTCNSTVTNYDFHIKSKLFRRSIHATLPSCPSIFMSHEEDAMFTSPTVWLDLNNSFGVVTHRPCSNREEGLL
ncbi:hypothetical protein SprV_0401470900 [Sparganum proliferum]